jgi:hypothetical protein
MQIASLSLPVMPRVATSGRSRLLMVGPCTAAEGGALGHGVARVSSRVLAFAYRLLFRCKKSDISNSNI